MDIQLLLQKMTGYWEALPNTLAGVLWLFGAWGLARFMRRTVSAVLGMLRFDPMCERTGVTAFLRTGRVSYTPARLIGHLCFWLTLFLGAFHAVRRIDPRVTDTLVRRLSQNLPGVFAATALLVGGLLLVSFTAKFVRTLAHNAATPYADLLAKGIRVAGSLLVISVAAEQIEVGRSIVLATLITLQAAVGLGLALAFGLGCREMARDAMQRFLREMRERSRAASHGDLED